MNDDEDEFYWNAATQNAAALCVTPTCLSACLTASWRISSHIWTRESLSSWTVWGAPETWCPRGVGVRSRSGERRCLHPARHCCVQSRVWGLMTVWMLWRSVSVHGYASSHAEQRYRQHVPHASPHPFTTVTCAQAGPEARLGTCGGPDNYILVIILEY